MAASTERKRSSLSRRLSSAYRCRAAFIRDSSSRMASTGTRAMDTSASHFSDCHRPAICWEIRAVSAQIPLTEVVNC